jgi:hypothetical protein
MRAITIEANSLGSARGLYNTLAEFHPELIGSEEEGYRVTVEVGGSDRQIVSILDSLQEYVAERAGGPARLELDGYRYTLHAVD